MNVIIKETREEESLGIIDPETSVEWSSDLVGNHTCGAEFDEETGYQILSQEDFSWWKEFLSEYQQAENRRFELAKELEDDKWENFYTEIENINVDLENYPAVLEAICDEYEQYLPV